MYTEQLNDTLGEFGSVLLRSKPIPFYLKMDLDLENIWSCLYWTTYKIGTFKWYDVNENVYNFTGNVQQENGATLTSV